VALSKLPPAEHDALVDGLRGGDPEAFKHLYEALHGRIYNLAARIVGDREDAADITQDVFLAAFRSLPGHTGELRVESWLYRVTVNSCYDHLRRAARRPTDSLTDPDELVSTVDEVERSQLSSAVSEALDQLNPRYRTALILKDLHGCGNAEVAEILGVNRGTAGVLLFRARKAFQQAFRKLSHEGAAGVSALGLAAFLPELPVPTALQTPPAFLSAPPVDPSAVRVPGDGVMPAEPPTTMAADPAPGPLLGDPALATTVAELAPAAAPAAGPAAAGMAAKLGSAAATKVLLAVAGVALLAGGGVTAGSLSSADGPPGGGTPAADRGPLARQAGDGGPGLDALADGAGPSRSHNGSPLWLRAAGDDPGAGDARQNGRSTVEGVSDPGGGGAQNDWSSGQGGSSGGGESGGSGGSGDGTQTGQSDGGQSGQSGGDSQGSASGASEGGGGATQADGGSDAPATSGSSGGSSGGSPASSDGASSTQPQSGDGSSGAASGTSSGDTSGSVDGSARDTGGSGDSGASPGGD